MRPKVKRERDDMNLVLKVIEKHPTEDARRVSTRCFQRLLVLFSIPLFHQGGQISLHHENSFLIVIVIQLEFSEVLKSLEIKVQ
jgi:hypothetical protein